MSEDLSRQREERGRERERERSDEHRWFRTLKDLQVRLESDGEGREVGVEEWKSRVCDSADQSADVFKLTDR